MENLPDLDQGPEVFETSDVESVEHLGGVTSDAIHPDIETENVNLKSAYANFEENTLVGILDLVDFSGSLSVEASSRSSYHPRKWTETRGQRLTRIARELSEIQSEDKDDQADVKKLRGILESSIENSGQRGYFNEQFSAAYERIENELKHLALSPESPVKENSPSEGKVSQTRENGLSSGELLDLESRIHTLERIVGLHELSSEKNLRMHLRDLDRKVNVLYNPEHDMEPIKQKVAELNEDLETLAKNRRIAQLSMPTGTNFPSTEDPWISASSKNFEKKVDSVYSRIEDIERAKARLPGVINRLRSLHETHSDVAHAVGTIGDFEDTLGVLKQDLGSWNDNLDEVKSALDNHTELFDEKSQTIESTLQAMELRVEALLSSDS